MTTARVPVATCGPRLGHFPSLAYAIEINSNYVLQLCTCLHLIPPSSLSSTIMCPWKNSNVYQQSRPLKLPASPIVCPGLFCFLWSPLLPVCVYNWPYHYTSPCSWPLQLNILQAPASTIAFTSPFHLDLKVKTNGL